MICLIPARGGSTRIPKKNIKDFHGRPIISYSILTALDSELFTKVVVSTDDTEIARIASLYGAEVIIRSRELSENKVGTQAVAQDAFNRLQTSDVYGCVLYATCPLLKAEDLVKGITTLKDWPSHDYAFSVDTVENENTGNDAGQFYFGRVSAFREGRPLHLNSVTIPLSHTIDINTPEDFARAEEMYALL